MLTPPRHPCETPTKGRGECSKMRVSPTATHLCNRPDKVGGCVLTQQQTEVIRAIMSEGSPHLVHGLRDTHLVRHVVHAVQHRGRSRRRRRRLAQQPAAAGDLCYQNTGQSCQSVRTLSERQQNDSRMAAEWQQNSSRMAAPVVAYLVPILGDCPGAVVDLGGVISQRLDSTKHPR